MIIDLNFITDDWKRKVLAEAVVSKAQALQKWSREKEMDIEGSLNAELEKATGSGVDLSVDESKVERLCNALERQKATTEQLVEITAQLAKEFMAAFGTSEKKPTQSAVDRAKALLHK